MVGCIDYSSINLRTCRVLILLLSVQVLGIIGLHTDHQLQEAGHHVTIMSKDPIDQTTSNAAASFLLDAL